MKTDDILIVGALALAAWMMLKGNAQAAPVRTITVAQPGAGTVGNANPLTTIADYVLRGLMPGTSATNFSPLVTSSNYSGLPGVYPGSQQDQMLVNQWDFSSLGTNNISGLPGVDYGSVQDQMLAQQW